MVGAGVVGVDEHVNELENSIKVMKIVQYSMIYAIIMRYLVILRPKCTPFPHICNLVGICDENEHKSGINRDKSH